MLASGERFYEHVLTVFFFSFLLMNKVKYLGGLKALIFCFCLTHTQQCIIDVFYFRRIDINTKMR